MKAAFPFGRSPGRENHPTASISSASSGIDSIGMGTLSQMTPNPLQSSSMNGINEFTGWEQTVRLPYDALDEFIRRSLTDAGLKQWKALSLEDRRRPKLEFCATDNLHAALSNKTVRRRLVCFLRDNFNWLLARTVSVFTMTFCRTAFSSRHSEATAGESAAA